MFMAALPGKTGESFCYIDGIVAALLVFGIFRGRKHGMTQELLPTLQWLTIVIVAGLFYDALAIVIFKNTSGAFNHLWSNITAYLLIAFAIHLFFLWLKQNIGEKLTGSDSFGTSEYYLGMLAGLFRYASIIVVAFAHSHVYTTAELAETEKMQSKNFEGIRFPTYGTVQHALLTESITGKLVQTYLSHVLIRTGPPTASPASETLARKHEDTINMILGTPKSK